MPRITMSDRTDLTRAQVIDLLDERDTLREALEQMRAHIVPQASLPSHWRLTGRERDVVFALRAASPNVCHAERLLIALYGVLADDMPEQSILAVWISKVRRKLRLAETGITIETSWGRGWLIDAENCRRLDAFIAAATETPWPADKPLMIAAEKGPTRLLRDGAPVEALRLPEARHG